MRAIRLLNSTTFVENFCSETARQERSWENWSMKIKVKEKKRIWLLVSLKQASWLNTMSFGTSSQLWNFCSPDFMARSRRILLPLPLNALPTPLHPRNSIIPSLPYYHQTRSWPSKIFQTPFKLPPSQITNPFRLRASSSLSFHCLPPCFPFWFPPCDGTCETCGGSRELGLSGRWAGTTRVFASSFCPDFFFIALPRASKRHMLEFEVWLDFERTWGRQSW